MDSIEINKQDAKVVLQALSIAIEHTNRALANCLEREGNAMSNTEIGNTIQVRRQTLGEFQKVRERLSNQCRA